MANGMRTIKKADHTGRLNRADVRAAVISLGEGRSEARPRGRSAGLERRAGSRRGIGTAELVQQLASRANISQSDARRAVEALFSVDSGIISEALKSGEKVQIAGFGSFETKQREARKGRNPRTGKEIDIAASSSAAFRPGKGLKDSIA